MIQLHYFARYREQLGSSGETLAWSAELHRLRDLRDLLMQRGTPWTTALGDASIMCARNEELCSLDTPLADGDVIAFFPPVTGG